MISVSEAHALFVSIPEIIRLQLYEIEIFPFNSYCTNTDQISEIFVTSAKPLGGRRRCCENGGSDEGRSAIWVGSVKEFASYNQCQSGNQSLEQNIW